MHYTKIHFKDYAADTAHLTLLEHGVYFQMMRLYYTNEKPLPDDADKVARFIGARTAEERTAVNNILEEFFTRQEDGWHQKRIDAEIKSYQERKEINTELGKRGGRPKKAKGNRNETESVLNGKPTETLTTNHKPLTTKNHKNIVGANAPEGFLKFWSTWPSSSRKGARPECLRKWLARGLESDAAKIVAHVESMKSGKQWADANYIPAPLTYINQSRWDGAEASGQDDFAGVVRG